MKTSVKIIIAGGLILCVAAFLLTKNDRQVPKQTKPVTTAKSPATPAGLKKLDGQSAGDQKLAGSSPFDTLSSQILSLLGSGNPYDLNKVYNELVPALVRLDPAAAAAFAQSQADPQWRADLMMVVAQSWAKLNPDDAQSWAANLTNPPNDPRERDTVLSYVCLSVADVNPERAVQVLEQNPINSDRRQIVVASLAQQWANQNLQPLIDWIGQLPTGTDRDDLFARIANAAVRTDPIQAGTIVSHDIAPGPIQDAAALNVVHQWAWNNKDGAANWVNQFLPGELRERAVQELNDTIAMSGL